MHTDYLGQRLDIIFIYHSNTISILGFVADMVTNFLSFFFTFYFVLGYSWLWRTGKPGMLQSMGLQRVWQDLTTKQSSINKQCPDSFSWTATAKAGDMMDVGSIPGSGRYPGEGHGNPLQHSCLENPMDRGAWQAIVHSVIQNRTWLKRLSTHAYSPTYSPPIQAAT